MEQNMMSQSPNLTMAETPHPWLESDRKQHHRFCLLVLTNRRQLFVPLWIWLLTFRSLRGLCVIWPEGNQNRCCALRSHRSCSRSFPASLLHFENTQKGSGSPHQKAAQSACPAGLDEESGSSCRISHLPSSAPLRPERSSRPNPPGGTHGDV